MTTNETAADEIMSNIDARYMDQNDDAWLAFLRLVRARIDVRIKNAIAEAAPKQ